MMQKRSVCVLSWILAAVLAASAHVPAFGDDAAAKLRKTLDDGKAMLRAYLEAIDPAEFDLKRKAAKLGKDPGEIFAFVRDEIGYEPYAGALRGAVGCLRAGAGNHVDKALLLDALLRLAEHKTRLAFGTLAEPERMILDQANQHLTLAEEGQPDLPYYLDSPALVEERRAARERMEKHVRARLERLTAALGPVAKAEQRPPPTAIPVSEGPDRTVPHVWVQLLQAGKAVDLDPSFPFAEPGQAFTKVVRTGATAPEEMWHRVTIRGYLERFQGGKVVRKKLFESAHKAKDLAGAPVVVQSGSATVGLLMAKRTVHFLALRIDGKLASDPVPTYTLTQPADAGGGEFIVAVAAEVVVSGPDQPDRVERRYLFDRWGLTYRALGFTIPLTKLTPDKKAAARLDGTALYLAVETGTVNPAYLQARLLRTSLATFEALSIEADRLHLGQLPGDALGRLFGDAYFHFFDQYSRLLLDCHTYASGPRLVTAILDASKKDMVFDVTRDPIRLQGRADQDLYRLQLQAGILSSIIEEELTRDPLSAAPGAAKYGTARAVESALARGPPVLVKTGPAIPAQAPVDAKYLMKLAVASGRRVVLPREQLPGQPFCWYELDPKTGRLRAWLETGLHGAGAETAALNNQSSRQAPAAGRFSNIARGVVRCCAQNVDSLIFAAIDVGTGGLNVGNAADAAEGVYACLSKNQSRKFERYARKQQRRASRKAAQRRARKLDSGGGHSYRRHGHQTTPKQHERRLRDGTTPDGRKLRPGQDPPDASGRFGSHAKHSEAGRRAWHDLHEKVREKIRQRARAGAGSKPPFKKQIEVVFDMRGAGHSFSLDAAKNVVRSNAHKVKAIFKQAPDGKGGWKYVMTTMYPVVK